MPERRVFSLNDTRADALDMLCNHGVPASLDALAEVLRLTAKWHREDGEPHHAKHHEGLADKLHALSLSTDRFLSKRSA